MKRNLLTLMLFTLASVFTHAQVTYLYSFEERSVELSGEKAYKFMLLNSDGTTFRITEDLVIGFEADEEKSTAVEGVSYELPSKQATIVAGSNSCMITVKALPGVTDENNSLVLKPVFTPQEGVNYIGGEYTTLRITLRSSFAEDLVGKWMMNEYITTIDRLNEINYGAFDLTGFPENVSENDFLIFEADGTLKTHMDPSSDFRKFFIGDATYEAVGTYTVVKDNYFPPTKHDVTVLKVIGVNRAFSDKTVSENDTAYIGVRIFEDEETGEELLDVYIIDYEPTDFGSDFWEYGMYAPAEPGHPYYAPYPGQYFNFTMKRSKNAFADAFKGSWQIHELMTTKESYDAAYSSLVNFEGFPEFNANDALEINDSTLVPSFQSALKNYFVGEAEYSDAGTYTIRMGMTDKRELTVMKISGVNRYLSATQVSESQDAYLGLRIIEDDETGEEYLDVYMIDYEPRDWGEELIEFGIIAPTDDGEPYMAWMVPINFTMKRGGGGEVVAIEGVKESPVTTVKPARTLIYNLQGQRLSRPQKGINIINGKKVLVR